VLLAPYLEEQAYCSAAGQNDVRHNASAEIGICIVVSPTLMQIILVVVVDRLAIIRREGIVQHVQGACGAVVRQ
jgi:hypothetical protein